MMLRSFIVALLVFWSVYWIVKILALLEHRAIWRQHEEPEWGSGPEDEPDWAEWRDTYRG